MSEGTAPNSEVSINDLGDPDATHKLQEEVSADDTDSNNDVADSTNETNEGA